ncbi:MAG: hypothetical protein LRZ84_14280 [Desertifilum sp.]|nr:hypothetical protein [Desertifilum sp.]
MTKKHTFYLPSSGTYATLAYINFGVDMNPGYVVYEADRRIHTISYAEAEELWGSGIFHEKLAWYANQVQFELYASDDGFYYQPSEYEVPHNLGRVVLEGIEYSYLPNPGVYVPSEVAAAFRADKTLYQIKGKAFTPEQVVYLLFSSKLTTEQWAWVVNTGLSATYAAELVRENEQAAKDKRDRELYGEFLLTRPNPKYTFYRKGKSVYVGYVSYKVRSISIRGSVGYSWSSVERTCNITAKDELGMRYTNDFYEFADHRNEAVSAWIAAGKPEPFTWEVP